MSSLTEQVTKYLREVLNISPALREWGESGFLPFFLQDGYTYYRSELMGMNCLLMVDENDEELSPATVRKHMDQVRKKWDGEVIYVRNMVTAYNRKRLINQQLPFIVPGNQLYLPMLAIDLREYFRQKRKTAKKFSPATQALVLYWIYNGTKNPFSASIPTEMAKTLGYSKMTMTRAFREVDAALESVLEPERLDNLCRHELGGKELWSKLHAFLRNPVKQRHYMHIADFGASLGLLAGLSALAEYSMLADPKRRVYAVSQAEWKVFRQQHEVVELDERDVDEQTVEVEVWGYSPNLFSHNRVVDRLSLYLSLRESGDERVESALDEALENIEW